jgi:hypothetical protein
MPLQNHTLTDKELSRFDALYASMSKDLRKIARAMFAAYLSKIDVDIKELLDRDIKPFEISRVMKNPVSIKYAICIVLYDFTFLELYPYLVNNRYKSTDFSDLIKRIEELSEIRKRQMSHPHAIARYAEEMVPNEIIAERIPQAYEGEFFGYRQGSEPGEIIRFHLKSTRDESRKALRFVNQYIRHDVRWEVTGNGAYINNTLYMSGNAKNTVTGGSLGMRYFALRVDVYTKLVRGIVITMDEDTQPIAARILMIPKHKHKLGQRYSGLDEKTLVTKMLENGKDGQSHHYEIVSQLNGAFGDSVEVRAALNASISNFTRSVLRTTMSYRNEEALEISRFPFDLQERLIAFCRENELSVQTVVNTAVDQYFARAPN